MRKDDFLAALRTAIFAAADNALKSGGQSTDGYPYIENWIADYAACDAVEVEQAVRNFAPETILAQGARDYIPVLAARVLASAKHWARTGELMPFADDASTEMGSEESLPGRSRSGMARASRGRGSIDYEAIQNDVWRNETLYTGQGGNHSGSFEGEEPVLGSHGSLDAGRDHDGSGHSCAYHQSASHMQFESGSLAEDATEVELMTRPDNKGSVLLFYHSRAPAPDSIWREVGIHIRFSISATDLERYSKIYSGAVWDLQRVG